MANKQIKIRKVRGNAKLPESKNGNWYDCYTSALAVVSKDEAVGGLDWKLADTKKVEDGIVKVFEGDVLVAYLGFATDLGKGYEAELKERSGTFPKYGLIQGNAVGLIDDSYCGDNDEWKAVFYCTRPAIIRVGERLTQMSVKKSNKVEFNIVETLGNDDRGGFGSTGK